jgi:hypothetical protein
MVGFWYLKLFSYSICFLFPAFWTIEYRWHWEHRHCNKFKH